jgi:uncharacterized protein (DUF4415 family)
MKKKARILSVLSQLDVRLRMKRGFMKLTKNQAKEIRALKRMKEQDIDLSDIPELTGDEKFVVGKFYRPIKKSLTIRIDADVLAWVKSGGTGYQTRINRYLRKAMDARPNYPCEGAVSFDGATWPSFNEIEMS